MNSVLTKIVTGTICGNGASSRLPIFTLVSRTMVSKEFRDPAEKLNKPKPYPYEKRDYNQFEQLWERSTRRWDDNTKLIVVDGSHAVGKSKLAQHIADQFEMKYIPPFNVDIECFHTRIGQDMREYNDLLPPRTRPWAEKEFAMNPTEKGMVDRFHYLRYKGKLFNYVLALQHMFSTGEGVVLEDNIHSDYVLLNAAFNAGFLEKSTVNWFNEIYNVKHEKILRPNLIVHLDADVATSRKNIAAKGNEWDKNSPLWNHKTYMSDIYNNMKQDYLKKAKENSLVLVYDWNEEGENDIVIEDIERLNFDWYDIEDAQQADWRNNNEDETDYLRYRYCTLDGQAELLDMTSLEVLLLDCDHFWYGPEENAQVFDVMKHISAEKYVKGYNPILGDKVMMKSPYYVCKDRFPQFHYCGYWDQPIMTQDNYYNDREIPHIEKYLASKNAK